MEQTASNRPSAPKRAIRALVNRLLPKSYKGRAELKFWKKRFSEERGSLDHSHYEFFYTEFFDLCRDDYKGKCVLDIGCGPRGSLEWISAEADCFGVDPLVDRYRELGIDRHRMQYVNAGAEKMPFDDAAFDIVASYNNLDHVDDVDAVVREIKRITKPGGTFLLITEVEHERRVTEPHSLPADVTRLFTPEFRVVQEEIFGVEGGIYSSLRERVVRQPGKPGLVAAKLVRR